MNKLTINVRSILLVLVVSLGLASCAEMETKSQAYPLMYTDAQPKTLLVVPAINKSTAADATDLINATLTMPFADAGYYVLPIAIASEVFALEGITDGSQIASLPMGVFANNFGADSVLFVTINKWDTNYIVIASNVTVGMSYVLMSTSTNEVLWSYDAELVINPNQQNSSGNILADLIVTALSTAAQDYIPIARQVNANAVVTLPFGRYHPKYGSDGAASVVLKQSREKALDQN